MMNPSVHGLRMLAVIAALVVLLPPLPACQICLPFPKESVVDYLMAADAVVYARENPEAPFSLKATRILKGESDLPAIDLFLDSPTRRLLKIYPDRQVVCIFRADGEEKGWRRIGVADEHTGPVMEDVLTRLGDWETSPEERAAYFAPFLEHENRQLSELAHLEVARAPYPVIKDLAGTISRESLHAFLKDVRYLEWHALYILFLAQSGNSEDQLLIAQKVKTAEALKMTIQLPAWATAWIEVEGETSLEFLETHYLRDPERSEEVAVILPALSVHGTRGHVHLRDRIVECYGLVVENHPELVPVLLPDLEAWERWDLAPQVAALLGDPPPAVDSAMQTRMRAYLRRAGEGQGGEDGDGGSKRPLLVLLGLFVAVPIVLGITRRVSRD